jgi:hypothetical protein
VVALPPPALLQCADAAQAPDLASVPWSTGNLTSIQLAQAERDRAVFEYILAERSAGSDCRSKLSGVRAWANEMERK